MTTGFSIQNPNAMQVTQNAGVVGIWLLRDAPQSGMFSMPPVERSTEDKIEMLSQRKQVLEHFYWFDIFATMVLTIGIVLTSSCSMRWENELHHCRCQEGWYLAKWFEKLVQLLLAVLAVISSSLYFILSTIRLHEVGSFVPQLAQQSCIIYPPWRKPSLLY